MRRIGPYPALLALLLATLSSGCTGYRRDGPYSILSVPSAWHALRPPAPGSVPPMGRPAYEDDSDSEAP